MNKSDQIERLYTALSGNIDTDAMKANVLFQVQLMAAIAPEDIGVDLQSLVEKVPKIIDMEDFLDYWVKAIAPHVTEEELMALVDYFESEEYIRVNLLMQKLEPLIQDAMIAYATAIGDQLLEEIIPRDESIPVN